MQTFDSKNCEPVFDKVEQWKKQLLDLTRRNKLLYLTESKAKRLVEITSPDVGFLLDTIVNGGHSLSFPMPAHRQLALDTASQVENPEQEMAVRRGGIETTLPVAELSRALYRLRRDWLTWQEEQGIHTLFLTIGLLKWKDANFSDEEFLAPIILLPVGLERKSIDEPYMLKFVEEDTVVNPALNFKLSADFGIDMSELPHDLDTSSLMQYFASLELLVKKLGWEVSHRVVLGRFTYEKFVMYSDLTSHRNDACQHAITRALAKAPVNIVDDALTFPQDLDEVVNPKDVFPILNADSSQTEVLLRARHRENLVVQGPPGTGKSQTIANLIAQALRDGMRVLFVSEKMAALEVVNRRLNAAGLSFACLEVHSHRSDKSKVVQELAKTLNASSSLSGSDPAQQFEKLVRLRDRLNNYVKELHLTRGALGLPTYLVHGRLSKLMDAPKGEFKMQGKALETNLHRLDTFLEAISLLQQMPNVFDRLSDHPWYGIKVVLGGQPQLTVADSIINLLNSLTKSMSSLQASLSPLTQAAGLEVPQSFNDSSRLSKLAEILSQPQPIFEGWLTTPKEQLSKMPEDIQPFKNHWARLRENRQSLDEKFDPKLLTLPVAELLDRFTNKYDTPFRWFKSSYRRDRASLSVFSKSEGAPSYWEAVTGLTTAKAILDSEEWLRLNRDRARGLVGQFYDDERTDWESITRSAQWLAKARQLLDSPQLSSILYQELLRGADHLSQLAKDSLNKTTLVLARSFETIGRLYEFLPGLKIEGSPIQDTSFSKLAPWLDSRGDIQHLQDWLRFEETADKCDNLGLKHFVETAIEDKIQAKDLRDFFLQRFWKLWLSEVYGQSPTLSEFVATSHEQIIQEFQNLDDSLKSATIQIVKKNIADRQPKPTSSFAKDSQRAILLREAQKKRRIKPLRRLFEEIPQLIQGLKPCLLMSPLSVASYLGTSPYQFDIVIFDEASQIPPADAIGSIIRGSCLIVAGDNRQLPPTRFFQADIDLGDDESEEDGLEEPLESILDECLALPVFHPAMLKWHYRSKSEELIDFSNKNVYDGALVTFPSPSAKDSTAAVELHYVSDGVYDRGGTRKNRQEAREAVDLIEDHYRRYGTSLSLGVITFSTAQEDAISEEWETRKIAKPDLAAISDDSSDEPFFIKALEKVQGDERDRIIISLGYGRDSKGVLSMNFGPINQSGGERRLNVAVTRAKLHLSLVSSILPQEVDPSRLSKGSRGVALLQKYLEYASNNGHLPTETYGGAQPESDFEYEVKEKLIQAGLDVDSQIGCSDFRIDLAVRNPKHRNRYVLGVECDGATYHSQRSARDRDRLRQEILESLGWKIYRVWSTDWIRNPKRIITEILERVRHLSEDMGIQAPDDPDPSSPGAQTLSTPSAQREPPVPISPPSNTNANLLQTNPYSLPAYEPFAEFTSRSSHKREFFYAAEESRTALARLAGEIQLIVNKESPIHFEAAARRISNGYEIERVGPNIRRIVERAVRLGTSKGLFRQRQDFLWNSNNVIPRVPKGTDDPRPLEEVAIEEIEAVLRVIVQKEIGVSKDSLIKTGARVLGYDRSGSKVDARIGAAVDSLLRSGEFALYGQQITVKAREAGSVIQTNTATEVADMSHRLLVSENIEAIQRTCPRCWRVITPKVDGVGRTVCPWCGQHLTTPSGS